MTAPTPSVKSHRRNERPVLIAVSNNDALAASAANIGSLMNRKGFFFVPFEQDDFRGKPTSCVADFTKILPAAAQIMGEDGAFISLIKPQFEAGRDRVGKKGVVRDAQVHRDVISEVLGFIENDLGWAAQALSFSPIRGPEGNIEFLVHILPKGKATHHVTQEEIDAVVQAEHESLHD